jgi:hypothetical protein
MKSPISPDNWSSTYLYSCIFCRAYHSSHNEANIPLCCRIHGGENLEFELVGSDIMTSRRSLLDVTCSSETLKLKATYAASHSRRPLGVIRLCRVNTIAGLYSQWLKISVST